jgi:XTP/dITP diphosphohydrolase
MQKLFIGTSNRGKRAEFQSLFAKQGNFELSFPGEDLDIPETGETFYQNAYLKAEAYSKNLASCSMVLADDSGLILDAFPDLLSVHTARYQSHLPTYEARANALLAHYQTNNEVNRQAAFVCVICMWKSSEEVYFFQGQVRGEIATHWRVSPDGSGFGYDGIFIPNSSLEKATFGEDPTLKTRYSHRTLALQEMEKFFQNLSKAFP